MRGKSHITLGRYLAGRYLGHLPEAHRRAFLLGCIQPDRNPATYLKGSLRFGWLQGHHYPNTRRFMGRLSRRLERRDTLRLLDCYALGKLIHYTADAFTFAHNEAFSKSLSDHRDYEVRLQRYFLAYLQADPPVDPAPAGSIMETIRRQHLAYSSEAATVHRDSQFALQTCSFVLSMLTAQPTSL